MSSAMFSRTLGWDTGTGLRPDQLRPDKLTNFNSLEALIVRAPSDEALHRFLHSVESKVPADKILHEETFARKLLLGSMQVMGREKSLRPDWERNLIGNSGSGSGSGELLDQKLIYISDQVLAVTQEDLLQAIRALSARELGRGTSCWFQFYF